MMKNKRISRLVLALTASVFASSSLQAAEKEVVLAAGCFWCMEEIYESLPGVSEAVSGYTGGKEKNPTYEQVSAGATGHAEAILVTYDDEVISLEKLLKVFWLSHDASNGSGVAPDFGKQYRSELYYANDEEKKVMEDSKAGEAKRLKKEVATKIVALTKFWPAEDYHQDYAANNPENGYVKNVSIPRMKRTLEGL